MVSTGGWPSLQFISLFLKLGINKLCISGTLSLSLEDNHRSSVALVMCPIS